MLNSLAGALSGTLMTAEPTAFFTAAASHFGNPLWHTVVIAMVCLVLMFGVTSGIEKVSRILMPLFYVLFIILAIWVATLPGAGEGTASCWSQTGPSCWSHTPGSWPWGRLFSPCLSLALE